jgi:hypothetical protein
MYDFLVAEIAFQPKEVSIKHILWLGIFYYCFFFFHINKFQISYMLKHVFHQYFYNIYLIFLL